METKRDIARNLIKTGKIKEAMKIVKSFDRTYSKDEMRLLQIAYECLSGKESFYLSIGENTDKIKKNAEILLQKII